MRHLLWLLVLAGCSHADDMVAAGADASADATAAECSHDEECPHFGKPCYASVTCTAGRCGFALSAYGDPLPDSQQTPHDCRRVACDGFGATTSLPSDDDVPDDGDPCTLDLCVDGVPHATHPPLPDGTPCDGGPSCVAGRCASDAGVTDAADAAD